MIDPKKCILLNLSNYVIYIYLLHYILIVTFIKQFECKVTKHFQQIIIF